MADDKPFECTHTGCGMVSDEFVYNTVSYCNNTQTSFSGYLPSEPWCSQAS